MMGYEDYTQNYCVTSDKRLQEVYQGNGAVPGLCILVRSFLTKYLGQGGEHKVDMIMPIYEIKISLSAVIFFNNTDIMVK